MRARHHFDWLVIGSGFGGSVAALRLAEKGYRVGVLECGRRYEDADFARSAWNLRRYFWAPRLGLRGIFRLTVFKDVFIASGSGVGGGSLGYANTLYRARPAFFSDAEQDPQRPNPTYIPAAQRAARWFAQRTGGIPQSGLIESSLNVPTTAHILGGAVIGGDPASGVIDADCRTFGYERLLVCDGSAVPANPGVNPSLTITALAERAMSRVPPSNGTPKASELPPAARA
jgi:choline dehydrogenase-like flavoprotein